MAIVRRHRGTQHGRYHGFATIRGVDDFRQRVSLSRQDTYFPLLDRVLAGEPDVLVPGRPPVVLASAGTTGLRKLVPATPRHQRALEAAASAWWALVRADHPRARDGAVLWLDARDQVEQTLDGTPVRTVAGLVRGFSSLGLAGCCPLSGDVQGIRDPLLRAYVSARCALAMPVAGVVSPDPWRLHLLFATLAEHAQELLRELHDGTLAREVAPHLRRSLARFLAPQPVLARQVSARATAAGRLSPRAAWPTLSFLASWVHGAATQFLPEVVAAAPGLSLHPWLYAAAEGCLAIPDQDADGGGLLPVADGFFEFLPVDTHADVSGPPLLAHELAEGGRYLPVLTNHAGLCRYVLDDVVEVVAPRHRCPRVRFLHRASSRLSLRDERVTEAHVTHAVGGPLSQAPVAHWAWAPAATGADAGAVGQPGHALLVERGPGPPPAAGVWDRLAREVDLGLQRVNHRYAEAQARGLLAPCQVVEVPRGSFHAAHVAQDRTARPGQEVRSQRLLDAPAAALFWVEAVTRPGGGPHTRR
jgi:hypothetical protein